MRKFIYISITLCLTTVSLKAQEDFGPINAGAANFLLIPTDARSAGMAGTATALTGQNNAIFNNASTIIPDARNYGATYTYTPWMRDYQSGFALHTLGGFYKIDKRNALLAGIRYYHYPSVPGVANENATTADVRPREMSVELGYAREIISGLAVSATARYILSDMGNAGGAKVAHAVAFDLGAIFERNLPLMNGATWAAGFQVSYIGTELKYLETKESLPSLAKLGGSVNLPFTPAHRLIAGIDAGYRFAPDDVAAFHASAGVEYILLDHYSLRGGYHYGDKDKGDDSFASAGLGVKYYGVHIDFAWLFAGNDSPINNSFLISAGFAF